MENERSCKECGKPIDRPSKTRPMELCSECKPGRRRVGVRKSFTCADCGKLSYPPAGTGALPERCDPCRDARRKLAGAERQKAWREANPERAAAASRRGHEKRKDRPEWRAYKNEAEMRRKYGLTSADFDALLASQGGVCAICKGAHIGVGKRFHVDHCHNSGRIRGLLCGRCNTAVGLLQDSPDLAEAAAAYLRR